MPAAGQGIDAGAKIAGRKRHLGVDALGLLDVWMTAASVSDSAGGIDGLSHIAAENPRVTEAGPTPAVQPKSSTTAPASASTLCRPPCARIKGFKVFTRRRVVERLFYWAHAPPTSHRRLRNPPHRSEAIVGAAMIDPIGHRLSRVSTPNWRNI
jgi:hypothetical protein